MPDPASTRRILVTAYRHIADVLAAVPALRALRATYPQARISLLAVDYVRDLMAACPYLDEVIPFRDYNQKSSAWGKVERMLLLGRLALRLYGRFDMVLILHARNHFLAHAAWLTGAKVRAGFLDSASPRIITHPARPIQGVVSFREINRRVLEAIGITITSSSMELWPGPADEEAVAALLSEHEVAAAEPLIALHPGSHWSCQQWSPKDWATVADHLVSRYGARLIITGTKDEGELAAAICEHMTAQNSRVIDLTGRTSILQFAALMKRLDVFLCVNSGAAQVGVAMRTPTINLYGYENPILSGPTADEPMIPVRGADDASAGTYWCPYHIWPKAVQCHRSECIGLGGLALITPNMVLRQVERQLKAARSKTAPASSGARP
jgi:heptosyltransferase-2